MPADPQQDASTDAEIAFQRRAWDRRAGTWDHGGAAGLGRVVAQVLDEAQPRSGMVAVDLGCGTGALALPLAEQGATVTAVDVSQAMVDLLQEKADSAGLNGVTTLVAAVEHLDLAPASVDLVVSNYAMHHLADTDKERVVRAAATWLRPGGRLVIGDMMFGRGATARDRTIIASKVGVMLRRGPAGWWRLAKNAGRFTFRVHERPVSMETWQRYLANAGFTDITATEVAHEAAVVGGMKPPAG